MKKGKLLLFLFVGAIMVFSINWVIGDSEMSERERRAQLDTKVDNNRYWIEKSKQGLTVLNPDVEVPQAIYKGSKIQASVVLTEDSPDVPVIDEGSSTQSENSVFVDPSNNMISLNSNNSTSVSGPPSYGADYLYSFDLGESWGGSKYGAGGNNDGDPAACIGTDGRWYINMISNGGQGVSYSDDQGETWTKVQVAPNPGSLADKNHMWIDAHEGSPYENYLYMAWTDFGGGADNEIVVKTSADNGETWGPKKILSQAVNAGNHNQGVNISTGTKGEAYAVWTIYDNWPSDEDAIGFTKTTDGGETWDASWRIIENIRGIRSSEVPQNMRVNSFPAMAVDCSNGANSGTIYVVWANIGVPGVNTGNDTDVYLIKSSDDGETWSEPIRVNQDETGLGNDHYLPWIAVDPANGTVSVIFYDNRNTNPNQAEAWVAISNDGGDSWEDFRVSDVTFTPSPIPGMAGGYFGDYLGISALNGKVYPVWTDNRSGHAMTYVSVFETLDITSPFALSAAVDQETAEVNLNWSYNEGTGFQNFRVYRNDVLVAEPVDMTHTETLLNHGYYTYKVTAFYGGDNESDGPEKEVQYGTSTISIVPNDIVANVYLDEIMLKEVYVKNTGTLDLDFSLSPFWPMKNAFNIAAAKGGGDEFIKKIEIGSFENRSASDQYSSYTDSPVYVRSGESVEIIVHAANSYAEDVCFVWIDWNSNQIFDEAAIKLDGNEDNSIFRTVLEIEKGMGNGLTAMRVRLSADRNMNAFDDTKYGETEDYALVIADWLGIDPDNGIIIPGDSLLMALSFDATGMETGSYNDIVKFKTNDINNSFYNLNVTMNVTDLQIVASADPMVICEYESTTLMATPSGGSGTFTYSWTSIPEGFVSAEQMPVVSPMENTKYIVGVDDGIILMIDTVEVMVNELPTVDLGTNQILCGETEYVLDAANEGSTYMWSTGEETQSITATGNGETIFWVDVTNTSSCSSRDSVVINFAVIPLVDLGADTTLCGHGVITLDAGNEGSEYLWSNGAESRTISVDTSAYGYGIQDYSVMVTNVDGCSADAEIAVEFLDCTGINEKDATVDVKLYPNPSNGIVNIEMSTLNRESIDIKITNINGQTIYNETNISVDGKVKKQINLSDYADGVYTVFISGANYTLDKKLLIQR